jgi:hypothetical protein
MEVGMTEYVDNDYIDNGNWPMVSPVDLGVALDVMCEALALSCECTEEQVLDGHYGRCRRWHEAYYNLERAFADCV